VQPGAWEVVEQLAAKGGWNEGIVKGTKKRKEGVEEKRGNKKRKRRE